MSGSYSPEDVLLAFSVEPTHDQATLNRYLSRYPALAEDLIDLAHELRLVQDLDGVEVAPEPEQAVQAAWKEYQACAHPDAGAEGLLDGFKGQAFADLARRLNVPRSILGAVRDRLVEPSTVPARFLQRLAQAVDSSAETVAAYLSLPPTAGCALSFKSDVKPSAPNQVSFAELVSRTQLTEAQRAELSRDLEPHGPN